MKDKKGQTTIFILGGILIVFIGVIMLILFGIFSTNLNESLSQDIDVGQVNLKTVSDQTIGKFNTMVVNNADWWGTGIIFGMVLALFLVSYFSRGTFPKIAIILDIFFILVAFIFALYLSAAYNQVVVALTSAGETFAEVSLPNTSYFILNLPLFTAIIGVIMMVLFHSSIPRKSEEANLITTIPT